jgi:hypothetical protein
MPADPSSIYVLIPDRLGVTVVAVGDLIDRLDDEESLEEAITNAGIDQLMGDPFVLITRVRALKETGDAGAYWDLDNIGPAAKA